MPPGEREGETERESTIDTDSDVCYEEDNCIEGRSKTRLPLTQREREEMKLLLFKRCSQVGDGAQVGIEKDVCS